MLASVSLWHWLWAGLREAAAMVWMTWWPLVLGFTLSGAVQSFLPRDGLRAQLGATTPRTVATSSILGVISSSCSYAASAMARALYARGASWPNSIIFMVASTNLVIELGIVLYLMLGWQFLAAQFVGGVLMIIALATTTFIVFSARTEQALRTKVMQDAPPPSQGEHVSWRERVRDPRNYRRAARYTLGDITMLRKELLAGFLIAGYLAVDVPSSWWSHIFLSGHGWITSVENAIIAPLLAVVSFVCSVGNIPLAAALWSRGVSFGGVIAFIFADLVTLPLLLIYRRFYGTKMALRLFALLWFVMSLGGLIVDVIFSSAHLIPSDRRPPALQGNFPLGATLVLNLVALAVVIGLFVLARPRGAVDSGTAIDPICGMNVDITAPVAVRERHGETFYFCSHRCAERFDRGESPNTDSPMGDAVDPICGMTVNTVDALSATVGGETHYFCAESCRTRFLENQKAAMRDDPMGDAVDPICGMTVNTVEALSATVGGETYYFCAESCRTRFLENQDLSPGQQRIQLQRKPRHE